MKAPTLLLAALFFGGCCGKKEAARTTASAGPTAGTEQLSVAASAGVAATAHVLVYRTKEDRNEQVPVMLSGDRKSILSYPHPGDLRTADGLTVPVELENGWLLDRRGIGMNVAFLRITYSEYAAMESAPSLAELEAAITDRDPLTDLCDCGPRAAFSDPVTQIGNLIRHDSLHIRCKRLK
ncbi:MAG: hypothetical protein K8H89_05075 [Flavobacteriales bacterium]|jgi:hypothetical protein|nr:hypothetical protein [Flavobacteriales bacterium]MCB0758175.1 hypothetical protein [Flavobacteriales bacterium]